MDSPDHAVYRRISFDWFRPNSIARLENRTAELAKRYVDRMAQLGGQCDFVTDVARITRCADSPHKGLMFT